MPLLRALKEHHYALYQAVVAVLGLVASLRILFDYNWQTALGYSVLTLVSYAVGQGLMGLIQRTVRRARGNSFD